MAYAIGDGVFWATASTAGEWTFIGHPRGEIRGQGLGSGVQPRDRIRDRGERVQSGRMV